MQQRGGFELPAVCLESHGKLQGIMNRLLFSLDLIWNVLDQHTLRITNPNLRTWYRLIFVPLLALVLGVVVYTITIPVLFINKFIHDWRTGLIYVQSKEE